MVVGRIRTIAYPVIFFSIFLVLWIFVIDDSSYGQDGFYSTWFASGLLLIILGGLATERHFTRPLDVIVNASLIAFLLVTPESFSFLPLRWPLFLYAVSLLFLALIAYTVFNIEKDKGFYGQILAGFTYSVSKYLGSSRVLFSVVFILSVADVYLSSMEYGGFPGNETRSLVWLLSFWVLIFIIPILDEKLLMPFWRRLKNSNNPMLVGRIVKLHNPNIVEIEQFEGSPVIELGDILILDNIRTTSISNSSTFALLSTKLNTVDIRYLRAYCPGLSEADIRKKKYAFKAKMKDVSDEALELSESFDKLVGYIYQDSDIDLIKIRMIEGPKAEELQQGDLVSVEIKDRSTKYQIINVKTDIEYIYDQNTEGGKVISAKQIGHWEAGDKQRFSGNHWVPNMNSSVTTEDQNKVPDGIDSNFAANKNIYKVGVIPGSEYPIYIDLENSMNHHIAIFGRTGSGKSQMAAGIIKKLSENDCKVVVFEENQSATQSLTYHIGPGNYANIDANKFNPDKDLPPENLQSIFVINLLSGNKKVTRTEVAKVIESIIEYKDSNKEQKVCIVMEEAYDFIPEWTFDDANKGQPEVTRITRSVLKSRKYDIGFLIITQRTAIVTKSILYQCNTVISLQSFDDTAVDFIKTYASRSFLDSLSILPRFHALVVGKGSSCDGPVIVDFFEEEEKEKE